MNFFTHTIRTSAYMRYCVILLIGFNTRQRTEVLSKMNEKQTNIEICDDLIYVLVIYDSQPVVFSAVAYRKTVTRKIPRTKIVGCPYCDRVFETVSVRTKVEVYRYSKKSDFKCHSLRSCKICHGIVGIKYAWNRRISRVPNPVDKLLLCDTSEILLKQGFKKFLRIIFVNWIWYPWNNWNISLPPNGG